MSSSLPRVDRPATPDSADAARRGGRSRTRRLRVALKLSNAVALSGFSWAYLACLSSLVVAAFVPPSTNTPAFTALLVLGFPMSSAAHGFAFVSGVMIFGPTGEGLVAQAWILVVFMGGAVLQVQLIEHLVIRPVANFVRLKTGERR